MNSDRFNCIRAHFTALLILTLLVVFTPQAWADDEPIAGSQSEIEINSIFNQIGDLFSEDGEEPQTEMDSGESAEEPAPEASAAPMPEIKPAPEEAQPEQSPSSGGFSLFKRALSGTVKTLQDKPLNPVLSHDDAALYKQVFAKQKAGDMEAADDLLDQVTNPLLLGHVLYQRYMHPNAYTSEYEELKNWMARYADHPNAHKIYSLAQKKGGAAGLEVPASSAGIGPMREPTMRSAKLYQSQNKINVGAAKAAKKEVRNAMRKGAMEALTILRRYEAEPYMDPADVDILKGDIAASFLYRGEVDEALVQAGEAAARSAEHAPRAAWVAGLVSWYKEDYSRAARYFQIAARSEYASGWMVTAASYWCARAHMRVGNVKEISPWLERGLDYPRTFYGLISNRALGVDFDFNWELPTFTRDYHDLLVKSAAGSRAVALAKVGQAALAQKELLRHRPQNNKERSAYLAFASYANLPNLAMRLASAGGSDEGYYDGALYPYVPWKPESGYKVDKALVHAIMKQESRFDPLAESPSGARGLMQMMPATARAVSSAKADMVDDPRVNLEIGQRYLSHLLDTPQVDYNLLYLLIAYNAGPGNLSKWRKRWPDVDDPLLFIELIPSSETRAYIERVLSNYWIYRMREGESLSSLDAIAAGRPAVYTGETSAE